MHDRIKDRTLSRGVRRKLLRGLRETKVDAQEDVALLANGQGIRLKAMETLSHNRFNSQASKRIRWSPEVDHDIRTGSDLLRPESQQKAEEQLRRDKPAILISSPPCDQFCAWSSVNNARGQRAGKAQVRQRKMDRAINMWRLPCRMCCI